MPSIDAGWKASGQLRRVGWLLHARAVESKFRALERAVKAKFDPNQPRVPAGDPDGGQWTDGGGGRLSGSAGSDTLWGSDNDDNDDDDLSDIPEERPVSARLRNAVIKTVARFFSANVALRGELRSAVGRALIVLEVASWVHEFVPYIAAYSDPPKSLGVLQQAIANPERGYDVHHVVEQTPAEQDGFPRSLIDSNDNLVRIPTLKHWQITGWFATRMIGLADYRHATICAAKGGTNA
jgi:hypothetical protein